MLDVYYPNLRALSRACHAARVYLMRHPDRQAELGTVDTYNVRRLITSRKFVRLNNGEYVTPAFFY